jgi:hypothetical protein
LGWVTVVRDVHGAMVRFEDVNVEKIRATQVLVHANLTRLHGIHSVHDAVRCLVDPRFAMKWQYDVADVETPSSNQRGKTQWHRLHRSVATRISTATATFKPATGL